MGQKKSENVNDYSARMWVGLISSYYMKQIQSYHDAKKNDKQFNVAEEKVIG